MEPDHLVDQRGTPARAEDHEQHGVASYTGEASPLTLNSFDVIVVGLGGMGSAAAAHAAARGQRVLGLEQFQPGHTHGSSHGRSRVIRLAYFEHPAYVPLLRRAYELWRRLESDTGRRLLQMTGGLMIGAPDSEVVSGSLRSAREHHLDHELLDARGAPSPLPAVHARVKELSLFTKGKQVPFSRKKPSARTWTWRRRHGADLHFDERVEDWRVARVRDDRGDHDARSRYECGRLILAPGAWAASLFKIDWLPLEVEPQVLYWFEPAGGAAPFAAGSFSDLHLGPRRRRAVLRISRG